MYVSLEKSRAGWQPDKSPDPEPTPNTSDKSSAKSTNGGKSASNTEEG